jgi:PAS domain S-box-containing protein/putative nucleotidyltransferase with HDIG domain
LKSQLDTQKFILNITNILEDFEFDISSNKIVNALEQICKFTEFDRAHIALISEDKTKITYSSEWCKAGIHTIALEIVDSNKFKLAELVKEINNREFLLLTNISVTSDYTWIDKNLLVNQGIQTFLFIPMYYNNKFIGFIDVYTVNKCKELAEEEIIELETVAQLLSNALTHKRIISDLKKSENYYRSIFNNTGTAKLVIENDNSISKLNIECESIFGYKAEEMLGTKWTDYFNDDMLSNLIKYDHTRRFDTQPSASPFKFISKLINKNGKVKTTLIAVNLIPETKSYAVAILDLSELYQVKRALEAISACNMAMVHATNEQELINNVCNKVVEVGGYRFAWVAYSRDDEKQTLYPAAYAGYEDGYLSNLKIVIKDPILGNGPFGKALRTNQIVISKNLEEDECFKPWRESALKHGYKSLIAFPLVISGKEPFGILGIYSEQTDIFDGEEVRVLSEMASDLTYGIVSLRTRIERDHTAVKLECNLEKMHQLFQQTVASLSNVVEMRDPYTAGHQRKVAELATALAKELGLSDEEAEGVHIAATIHDIGKVKIPAEILSKPGKLNALEFEIIKTHSQAGYDILKDTDYPWPIAKMILQHHEKMDGSGYPNGLTKDEILIGARIISIADVVEAMASHRPYRPSLGMDRALEEVILHKGTKYDAEIVDACLNVISKGFRFD